MAVQISSHYARSTSSHTNYPWPSTPARPQKSCHRTYYLKCYFQPLAALSSLWQALLFSSYLAIPTSVSSSTFFTNSSLHNYCVSFNHSKIHSYNFSFSLNHSNIHSYSVSPNQCKRSRLAPPCTLLSACKSSAAYRLKLVKLELVAS